MLNTWYNTWPYGDHLIVWRCRAGVGVVEILWLLDDHALNQPWQTIFNELEYASELGSFVDLGALEVL